MDFFARVRKKTSGLLRMRRNSVYFPLPSRERTQGEGVFIWEGDAFYFPNFTLT
jgi:hypothetical protein